MSVAALPDPTLQLSVVAQGGLGDGIARLPTGEVVLVAGAVSGDVVLAALGPKLRGVRRAELRTVIAASPDRAVPPCAAFGVCGGCDLQHLTLAAQHQHKLVQLQRIIGERGPTVQLKSVTPEGHRRRMRVHLRQAAAGPVVGFLAQKSDAVAVAAHCLALVPALEAVRRLLPEVLGRAVFKGELHAIVGAEGVIAALTGLPLRDAPLPQPQHWARALGLVGLRWQLGPLRDAWGIDTVALPEIAAPWQVRVHGDGFCQASAAANVALRQAVAAALTQTDAAAAAIEFFAGAGNFTDLLLAGGRDVLAVERDERACALLRGSAVAAGSAGKLTVAHTEVAAACRNLPPAGLWLLDPGRLGAPEVAAAAARHRPSAIVYVSCALDTLSRDLTTLRAAGYRIAQATLVDAFPWTVHAESVVVLQHD